jgi:hypothetical protein
MTFLDSTAAAHYSDARALAFYLGSIDAAVDSLTLTYSAEVAARADSPLYHRPVAVGGWAVTEYRLGAHVGSPEGQALEVARVGRMPGRVA